MFFWQYKLLESLEVVGIRMVIGSTPVYGNGGMSEQVRCSAFDNEGCYHDEGSGLVHYLHNSAGDATGQGRAAARAAPPRAGQGRRPVMASDCHFNLYLFAKLMIYLLIILTLLLLSALNILFF